MNTEQLIEELKRGNRQAIHTVYSIYGPYLMTVCSRYIPAENDAKDVFQDSFIKIINAAESIEATDAESLKRWMRKIVVNEAVHFLRTSKKLDTIAFDEDICSTYNNYNESDFINLRYDRLKDIMRKLPLRCRTVFNLYVFEHKSHREISEILGISVATSSKLYVKAKLLIAKTINHS